MKAPAQVILLFPALVVKRGILLSRLLIRSSTQVEAELQARWSASLDKLSTPSPRRMLAVDFVIVDMSYTDPGTATEGNLTGSTDREHAFESTQSAVPIYLPLPLF